MTKEWTSFLAEIAKAKQELDFEDNEECFYRGHEQDTWQLCPGLLRDAKSYKQNLITENLFYTESDLFYEFRSRARVLHHQNMSDWDVLFSMQHHKVKTRLLDWTETLGTAIYFALEKYRPGKDLNPCIWLLNPYTLNEITTGDNELYDPERLNEIGDDEDDEDGNRSYSYLLGANHDDVDGEPFYWDGPVAIYPLRKNDRLTSQGGYFTIHGNDIRPIEELDDNEDYLRKIKLPKAAIPDALNFLELAGINDFTMFPDLDGLATYLNKKYIK